MLVSPIKEAMRLSDVQMSLVLGASFAVSFAGLSIPMGWIADRLSRRVVILAGTLVWAVATITCGLVTGYHALLLCRVLVGLGEAAVLPAAYSLIADGFPAERVTVATSVFQSASKIGSAAAFGLGRLAIGLARMLDHVSWPLRGPASYWQITFVIVGAPGLVLAFLASSFPDPGGVAAASDGAERTAAPARDEAWRFIAANARLCLLVSLAASAITIVGYSLSA